VNSFYQEFEDNLKNRGLHYGGGRIDHSNQYFYLNIPKNASNFLDRLFAHSGWNVANLRDIDSTKIRCIIVLRDPIERWLTGITQYAMLTLGTSVGNEFVKNYNSVVEKLLFDQVVFDDHTMPQYYFFDCVKHHYNIDYFYYDSTVVQRMANRYNLQLDQEFEGNTTQTNTTKKTMMDFLRSQVNQNKNLLEAIKSKYREDYRLINNVEFQ
jgi:hypothetical protein